MRWLKMLLVLVLCIVIMLVGIMFTIHNTDKVAIDLIFIQLPKASLSLWIIAVFILGAVLGSFLSSLAIITLKTKLNLTRKKVLTLSKELENNRPKVVS